MIHGQGLPLSLSLSLYLSLSLSFSWAPPSRMNIEVASLQEGLMRAEKMIPINCNRKLGFISMIENFFPSHRKFNTKNIHINFFFKSTSLYTKKIRNFFFVNATPHVRYSPFIQKNFFGKNFFSWMLLPMNDTPHIYTTQVTAVPWDFREIFRE